MMTDWAALLAGPAVAGALPQDYNGEQPAAAETPGIRPSGRGHPSLVVAHSGSLLHPAPART